MGIFKRNKNKNQLETIDLFVVSSSENWQADQEKNLNLTNLFSNSTILADNHILCIAASGQDALEYAQKRFKNDNLEHFQAWCNLRNANPDASESWNNYMTQVLAIQDDNNPNSKKIITPYYIYKVTFSKANIAVIFRLFCSCIPLGCSFENAIEMEYFLSLIQQTEEIKNIVLENSKKEEKIN